MHLLNYAGHLFLSYFIPNYLSVLFYICAEISDLSELYSNYYCNPLRETLLLSYLLGPADNPMIN